MHSELFIAWRYLVTKRKEKFISLISIISIAGVAIGVAALIVVLGVMTGFDIDLREKIVGNYAHLTITSYRPMDASEYREISDKLISNKHILGVSPYIQGQVLAKEEDRFFAVGLRGIDPVLEQKVTKVKDYLVSGNIADLKTGTVIIGRELAGYLGVGMDDSVRVVSVSGKPHSLKVVGIFSSGMYDYDMNLAFTNLASAQEIFGMGNQITAIAVKLDDLYLADKIRKELRVLLGNYNIRTWMEVNQNFFAALALEKLTMFIILTLIILVASFNIISTLIVLVVDKTKDIGILKSIGMNSSRIRRIFTYEGLIIGGLGTLFGVIGGIGLCALLKKYQFVKLPQDVYYLDKIPVVIQLWPDLALIILAAMGITLISTIYPAGKAAGFKPVEALRYE
jgi:lipoprotein-releasing system permease protein